MATNAKWAGKPHKTCEPIRARERSRRLGPGTQPFPLYVSRFTFHVSRITSCRADLPRQSAAEAGARFSRSTCLQECHRRIAPFLHRFFTDFRKCISLLPVPQPLAKSDPKNGAIPH
jgi:hypothetical protein